MIHQNCQKFFEDIAHDTYNGLVLDGSEGNRIAGDQLHLCQIWTNEKQNVAGRIVKHGSTVHDMLPVQPCKGIVCVNYYLVSSDDRPWHEQT